MRSIHEPHPRGIRIHHHALRMHAIAREPHAHEQIPSVTPHAANTMFFPTPTPAYCRFALDRGSPSPGSARACAGVLHDQATRISPFRQRRAAAVNTLRRAACPHHGVHARTRHARRGQSLTLDRAGRVVAADDHFHELAIQSRGGREPGDTNSCCIL